MIKSTFDLENQLLAEGYDFVVGIDEAGRGPLAGPVVAAATTVRKSEIRNPKSETNPKSKIQNLKQFELIRDSKTLSHKQRESLFDFIHENFYIGVGICDHKTIDRINILEATYLAVKKSLSDLFNKIDQDTRYNKQANCKTQIPNHKQITKHKIQKPKQIVLFDGNRLIPNLSMEQKAIVNGDKFVKSISAASIIAKVTRDRIMLKMHEKYPKYSFEKHKGYGTKMHFAMLEKNGPCEIHRRSFEPVKSLMKKGVV